MNNDGKKYFIKIKGALVEVTDEIYIAMRWNAKKSIW